MAVSREQIAKAVNAPKQNIDVSGLMSNLGYSSGYEIESFDTPVSNVKLPYGGMKSRRDMIAALQAPLQMPEPIPQASPGMTLQLSTPEPQQGGGVFDIPILGPALDLLDTPRAMIVSTIKEVGDIFGEGDASLSDWFNQSRDNIMAGEVLRDWGVDLPGPLDFVVGLGLDIVLDPLTYAAGAGLIARAARAGDVAANLSQGIRAAENAAEVARKAGDTATAAAQTQRAKQLTDTFDVVRTRGVIAATASNPAVMQEMGIRSGLHFVLPGTGRIGRRIIERPLTSVVPSLGQRAARRRVNELAQAPWLAGVDEGFDIAKHSDKIVARMTGGEAIGGALGDSIEAAARKAASLPISRAVGGARTQNVTSKALGFLAGGVGRGVTRASQMKFFDNQLRRINSKGALIGAKRGTNTNIARFVFDVERYGNEAAISSLRWNKQTTDELDRLVRDLRVAGVEGEDLDSLMFYAATSTDEEILNNPALARWIEQGADGPQVSPFVAQAREWWKSAGRRAGIPEDEVNDFFYAARMRDDIEFKRGAASRIDPEMDGIPLDNATLSGSPNVSRRLLTPDQIKKRINNVRVDRVSPEAKAYADDIARLEAKAEALIRGGDTRPPEQVFNAVLDDELAQGVRYGQGNYVSTNVYAGQALDNSNILDQMARISREATDVDPKKIFKFSDDATAVLPRYISLMTKNLRSQKVLQLAKQDGYLIPSSRLEQGLLSAKIDDVAAQLAKTEGELDDLRQRLVNADMDEDEVAGLLADIAKRDGIFSEQDVRDWLKTTDGQLAAQVADMQVQLDTMMQVLRASADGTYYTGLSPAARQLLDDKGWRDAVEGPFTQAQRQKVQRLAADSEARLEALAEATEFLHELQLIAGRLQTQRNQIGAVLKQLEAGRNPNRASRAAGSGQMPKTTYDNDGAMAYVSSDGYISNFQAGQRGQGYGSRLLDEIVADADLEGVSLTLQARPELHEFYGRWGFVVTDEKGIGNVPVLRRPAKPVATEGARMRPATIRTMLETQAAQLDEVFEQLRYISSNIEGNVKAFDPTFVAGRGLAALGDPEVMAQAQRELFEEMVGIWGLSDDLRRVAASVTDLPDDGRLVRVDWKGGNIGWEIRWNARPLAGQGDRRTLRTLMGEERADYMGRVLATLDDSPAGRAQAALLETMENARLMQNRLGNIVPGQQFVDAVEQSLGDADALYQLLRMEYQTDLDLMIDGFLDQRLAVQRRSPAVRQTMDELEELSGRIESEINAKVQELQKIAEDVKNKGNRRVLLRAALYEGPNSLTMRRNAALRAAKRGDTAAALDIAKNPAEAMQAVARGQGNAAFVDMYLEGAESVIGDMLIHTFRAGSDDAFAPTVGNITKSKLAGQSFVAPMSMGLSKAEATEMAKVFSEVFEAMARTADPAQLNNFFRQASKLANWWKAQAVGTPGFVMRNMIGAMWMNNQLAGMPLSQMRRVVNIRDAARKAGNGNISAGLDVLIEEAAAGKGLKMSALAGGGRPDVRELRTFKEWYDSGIAAGTGGRGIDIRSSIDQGLVEEGQGFRTGLRAGTFKPTADFKLFSAIRGWNADVEFMARGSLAHHTMMSGGNLDEALSQVYKYHFDYTDLTAFEVSAKQMIPFWTWQRRALPMLIESVARNPKAWNRISNFKGEMELHSQEEGLVPDYFGENMGIRLPFKIGGYRAYTLPSLPFADLANWAKAFDTDTSANPLEFGLNLARPGMEASIPHFRFPVEYLLGTRTFNQVPFKDELQVAPKWANVPVISEALLALNMAERSRDGTMLMTDKWAYGVEQFIPVLANWSRLDPTEDPRWSRSDSAKQIATLLNFTFGPGIRANTPKEKRNERLRQMYTDAADERRRQALARL